MFTRYARLLSLCLTLAVALTFVGGCQTYVNIPHQAGDVASANVNGSKVRKVMGESLRGLRGEALAPGRYEVILPAGATPKTYESVIAAAGEPYTWADAANSTQVVDTLEIRAIRVRGWEAAVDIIRSTQPGDAAAPRQLVTVYLKDYVIGGWASRRVRVWRMNVADALLISAGQPLDDASSAPANPDQAQDTNLPEPSQNKEAGQPQ